MKKLFLTLAIVILLPTMVSAQRYLVDLPIDTQGDFNQYINLLYKMSISIAALLAVVKIVVAGAKYMLSDIVTNKSDAKKDIQGALLGLLLILGAVIILNTINPALTDGGLNIRKIVVPDLDISDPVQVTTDSNGNAVVTGAATNPDGTLKPGVVSEGYQITDYPNIESGYWNTTGNIVVIQFDRQCQARVAAGGGGGSNQYVYDACVAQVTSDAHTYCEANYGRKNKTATDVTCQLPTERRYVSDFSSEFAAYKETLPVNDYAGRDATAPSNEVMLDFCTDWGGTYLTYRTWRNVCVKYN